MGGIMTDAPALGNDRAHSSPCPGVPSGTLQVVEGPRVGARARGAVAIVLLAWALAACAGDEPPASTRDVHASDARPTATGAAPGVPDGDDAVVASVTDGDTIRVRR